MALSTAQDARLGQALDGALIALALLGGYLGRAHFP